MEIKINGKKADVTAESEKTVGEVMASLEQWLADSGHRLSGLAVDGITADSSSLEEAFSRDIETVKNLDIYTSSVAELIVQSLLSLSCDIDEFESLSFDERQAFFENWKVKPQAVFTCEQTPDLFELCANTFSSGGVSPEILRSITEERLREVKGPADELTRIQSVLNETCSKLADLPLDIQTGKDLRAAQTIQLFTGFAEKIFRIIWQLDIQGYIPKTIEAAEKTLVQLIGEFGAAAKEFLQAYEKHDSVLVGDLAEYEIAPRLQELYAAVVKYSGENAAANRG